MVEYKSETERPYDGDKLGYYFSDDRFKYKEVDDKSNGGDTYSLSLCTTCMIVRPPRAFHCSACGVCVEV